MQDFLSILYLVLGTILPTIFFTHIYIKKNKFISSLDEYLSFKKLAFNKKLLLQQPLGNIVIISFYVIMSFLLSFASFAYILLFTLCAEELNDKLLSQTLKVMFGIMLVIVIVRLIYEFLVIPFLCIPKQPQYTMPYNQQIHMQAQSPNRQNTNTNVPNHLQSDSNIQQLSNISFIFCSQCGTRYNEKEINCPNCGKR